MLAWFGSQAIVILTVNLNRYPGLEATSQQHMAWLSITIPRPQEMPRAVLTSAPLQDTTGADMSVKSSCISAGFQGRKPNGFPVRSIQVKSWGALLSAPSPALCFSAALLTVPISHLTARRTGSLTPGSPTKSWLTGTGVLGSGCPKALEGKRGDSTRWLSLGNWAPPR